MGNPIKRRAFVASGAACSLAAFAASGFGHENRSQNKHELCVFTKPFQSLSYDELAERTAQLGLDGIEAPIRDGGHIEPAAVPDELPKMMEALGRRNLKMTVMTSSINDPADPLTEKVLRTAAGLGIRHYRMKYFKYDESRPIPGQITEWQKRLKDLAAMNRELGITAVYQNHAGRNYFGASLWDLHRGLEGIDPIDVGVAYDIRHATAEGGMSWPVTFQLIRPHIQVVYVKDFVWHEKKPGNVPLGKGRVDPAFFSMLAKSGYTGPISLHEEYLDHKNASLVPAHWKAIREDLQTLQGWLS
ncbi:MAG: sugar phosphate isomerase/epimerase [Fuerstiella sp.]|nr:sugar phosphate isomerase/epimerase [Fuerstiella sp.]MCP4856629.1 sugar phosphate isomerase/epimerase [Fuerstiella sp.]